MDSSDCPTGFDTIHSIPDPTLSLSQETRVQMRFVDVASNVCLALSCGVVRGAVAGGRGAEVGAGGAR